MTAPKRDIEVRLVRPDGTVDDWDCEWFTEEEAIDHLSDSFSLEEPDGMDPDASDEVYDAPWDHPEHTWVAEDGTRVRVSRSAA